ncbi:MAG TPA: response regulator, partial [Thermodesulfobacteriota bacterium]|nr:response regulator [Thermodesulfobacteriota bacterium]
MGIKILVVDDHPDILALLAAILKARGYQPLLASTASTALALADERPELAILDINLPDLDGLECCRRLRRQGCGMPVLFTSAGPAMGPADLEAAGGNGFLPKPFDPDELLEAIGRLRRGERAWRTEARVGAPAASEP